MVTVRLAPRRDPRKIVTRGAHALTGDTCSPAAENDAVAPHRDAWNKARMVKLSGHHLQKIRVRVPPARNADPISVLATQTIAFLTLVAPWSCGPAIENDPSLRTSRWEGLTAYCEASVEGIGIVDVEDDYVPHVVACENGAAGYEALRAQAVAARSYLYYRLETQGSIADGQSDQVYTCAHAPEAIHVEAARSTRGEVLSYAGEIIAAFYVAGAVPEREDCVAEPGDPDPFETERYVTYNLGRSGDDVIQTPLGWIDPRNHRNRGCQSQNGARCLAEHDRGYREILAFYYGADLTYEGAIGPCTPFEPPDEIPVAETPQDAGSGQDETPAVDPEGKSVSDGAQNSSPDPTSTPEATSMIEGDDVSACRCLSLRPSASLALLTLPCGVVIASARRRNRRASRALS